jgi:hypothetical protein
MNRNKSILKIHKLIWVFFNLGFVRVTAMDRQVFGRVEKSRGSTSNGGWRSSGELHGLRRRTANFGDDGCGSNGEESERDGGELG